MNCFYKMQSYYCSHQFINAYSNIISSVIARRLSQTGKQSPAERKNPPCQRDALLRCCRGGLYAPKRATREAVFTGCKWEY